jgi:hypothetical protein
VIVEPAAALVLVLALVLLLQPATVAASAAAIANMAMGEGRGTILTLPVFGFFGSLLAPVDLEFVDGEGTGPAGRHDAVGEPDWTIHRCTSPVRQPSALATQPHGLAIFTLFQAFF